MTIVGRWLPVAVPRPGVQADRDVWQPLGLLRQVAQPGLSAGVGEDVTAFGGADVGGYGDDGHASDQAAGHGQHRRCRRRGQHGDPVRATDAFGDRRRPADEVAATQRHSVDAHRVADVVPLGDCVGVQRGQQHVCEATRRAASVETQRRLTGHSPSLPITLG
jgi:hypothetical protein